MLIKKIYGLIGKDIDYSFSRNYFNSKFKKLQILENEYINFDLKNISDFKKINLSNIYGFNVTIPYKESIIPLLDKVSDEASIIGAVNTIKIINGKLKGYNTDYIGFSKSLKNKKYYHALIFGSGGACKAIQFSLMKLNIKFKVVSRQNKAHFINYDNLEKEIINSDLIINTTPLGTYPNVNDKIQIPYELINGQKMTLAQETVNEKFIDKVITEKPNLIEVTEQEKIVGYITPQRLSFILQK